MLARDTNQDRTDAVSLALRALAWTLGDSVRAERLLSLTGLTPDDLRARAGAPVVLSAVLGFLESHEPDLIACADALAVRPAALVAARAELEHA
ncbi:MAG: DUF3572 domain-containing protein [Sphingomonas sp.]|uniref:DUF3572 domain-containing protein n=1 Tax=Sphingomonas sp. TaxID=28214 RepID=UPI000DB1C9A5|nr:DUF3572 domain-containing protein [Zymomonas sp.]MBA4771983.1 DUF3572 domain-containing protein [Sphingomonas sp.]PZP18095.1 MAG: DUF3572 domain-containing protein [Sphingomonas hengshuiensis]